MCRRILLTSRAGYDIPDGDLQRARRFRRICVQEPYTIDNANLTSIPGYGLVNLNVHYSRAIADSYVKNIEVYFDVKNLFDRTYVAGANVLTNTLMTEPRCRRRRTARQFDRRVDHRRLAAGLHRRGEVQILKCRARVERVAKMRAPPPQPSPAYAGEGADCALHGDFV